MRLVELKRKTKVDNSVRRRGESGGCVLVVVRGTECDIVPLPLNDDAKGDVGAGQAWEGGGIMEGVRWSCGLAALCPESLLRQQDLQAWLVQKELASLCS